MIALISRPRRPRKELTPRLLARPLCGLGEQLLDPCAHRVPNGAAPAAASPCDRNRFGEVVANDLARNLEARAQSKPRLGSMRPSDC
jgi:hypothetical protein